MNRIDEKREEIYEFYSLVEKYGFCTPWCECSECDKQGIRGVRGSSIIGLMQCTLTAQITGSNPVSLV